MIGITPRKGDRVWVLKEHQVDDITVQRQVRGVFMGYERGKPIVAFPDGTRDLLMADSYMRVA